MQMWVLSAVLFLLWLVLKFALHKSGFIHILLLSAISIFVIQLAAYRKTKYQQNSAKE